MGNFKQAAAAYDDLLEKLAEAKTAKQTVSDRIAELDERIPALEAEKIRLTKLAALGKTDNVKLAQTRRELADCIDDLGSLKEQLAMFQPNGEIMDEILAGLDAAYSGMARAHSQAAEEAYAEAATVLKADLKRHMPRVMMLHQMSKGFPLDVSDFFKDLCWGIKADHETLERLPYACSELSAYRHRQAAPNRKLNSAQLVEVSHGAEHGALPPEKPYEGPLYGGEVLSLSRYGKLSRGVTLD